MMMLEGHSRKDSERRRKKRKEIDSMLWLMKERCEDMFFGVELGEII